MKINYFISFLMLLTLSGTILAQEISSDPDRTDMQAQQWSYELSVEETTEEFNNRRCDALAITIYDYTDSKALGLWKDEFKKRANKVSTKKGITTIEQITVPDISGHPLNIYSTVQEYKNKNAVRLVAAFEIDGDMLMKSEKPELYEKVKAKMYDLSVDLNRKVVQEQIGEQEKALEDLEKQLEKLLKQNEQLHASIAKNEANITKDNNELQQLARDYDVQKSELADFQARTGLEMSKDDEKELKKLEKAVSSMERKQKSLSRNLEKYEQDIQQAEDDIEQNLLDQEQTRQDIELQKEIVYQHRQKLGQVR